MELPFQNIVLTRTELEALFAAYENDILIENENQTVFQRLSELGLVGIKSGLGRSITADTLSKGIGITKPVAIITEYGKAFALWLNSQFPPEEPPRNPIGF